MKNLLKQLFERYFNSWWIPAVMSLAVLAAFAAAALPHWNGNPVWVVAQVLAAVFVPSLLGILAAVVWNFIRGRWLKALINLLAVPVCGAAAFSVFALVLVAAMCGPSEDGFGKDIVMPPDMTVELPTDSKTATDTPATDADGQALIASFATNTTSNAGTRALFVDLPVLNEFAGPKRAQLLRHLATSAKWFVTKEQGKIYACRRCVVNGYWQANLNGYYSANTFDRWGDQHFQFRIILGPNGPVLNPPWQDKTTAAKISERIVHLKTIEDQKFKQGIESYLVLESKGAAVEIFEQSPSHNRPFTPLALQQVNNELKSVLASPVAQQRGFDPSLMPPASIKAGEPEIHLANGMQGGIYFVRAYVNPGEPGYVYLKAFEATKNTPLSESRIPARSTEYIGWSNNPQEQFFYTCEITVYEGDWGVYYPARFELWFVPDSGKPERKLLAKIFRIDGWQR